MIRKDEFGLPEVEDDPLNDEFTPCCDGCDKDKYAMDDDAMFGKTRSESADDIPELFTSADMTPLEFVILNML